MTFVNTIPSRVRIHSRRAITIRIGFLYIRGQLQSGELTPLVVQRVAHHIGERNVFRTLCATNTVLPNIVSGTECCRQPLGFGGLIRIKFATIPLNGSIRGVALGCRLTGRRRLNGSVQPVITTSIPRIRILLTRCLGQFRLCVRFDGISVTR